MSLRIPPTHHRDAKGSLMGALHRARFERDREAAASRGIPCLALTIANVRVAVFEAADKRDCMVVTCGHGMKFHTAIADAAASAIDPSGDTTRLVAVLRSKHATAAQISAAVAAATVALPAPAARGGAGAAPAAVIDEAW